MRNRIVMAPMATLLAEPDGRYSERQIDYFVARAKGGVGLILTEATMVEREVSPPSDIPTAFIDSPWHIPRAAELVDAVHDFGVKIGIQLSPGPGRYMVGATPGRVPISASPLPSFVNPNILCHELTVDEIKRIVYSCSDAALRAAIAGFDLIELHAHTGYLIDQFMTPLWNKRNDEYGGGIEGRMRFPIEMIDTIRAKVGLQIPLSFRYSAEHGIEGGRALTESQEIARRLEAAGLDVLHIDAGCYEADSLIIPPTYLPQGCLVEFARAIKRVVNIPVITVGSIMTPELAEQILNEGRADFICLGRALFADPDWPNKAREGRVEDIRPCIRCNERCIGNLFLMKSISCSVNPTVCKERYYAIHRTKKPKKVMVIGGGPAGMEAARVAALKGHKVTLYEKENELGGQLRAASQPSFKGSLGELLKFLRVQLDKFGVRVEKGKEVTSQLVDQVKPQAVIVATGANPLVSVIPGIKQEKKVSAVDLFLSKKKLGSEIIVVGAGLIGCETALYLAQKGKKVTIIKVRPGTKVAEDLNSISRRSILTELAKNRVSFLFNHTIKEFNAKGLVVSDKEGIDRILKADTIVLALGAKPKNKLAGILENKINELYIVGDCVSPRKIGDALHEGYVAGWQI